MKTFALTGVLIFGAVILYGTLDFPAWGDPQSPASRHVSNYYIQHTLEDTAVPNIVTSVLADYRGYDTLFETTVILSAGIACFFLLRRFREKPTGHRLYRHIDTGIILIIEEGGKEPADSGEFMRIDSHWVPHDLIIRTGARLMVPFLQLFALYVVAHGHHSPGGGFQGGVILGATFILLAISGRLRSTIRRVSEKASALMASTGVLIYVGTGVVSLLLGANFLDYGALSQLFRVTQVMARSYGILMVEIGVSIAVCAVMIWIYYNLASAGRHDEGL